MSSAESMASREGWPLPYFAVVFTSVADRESGEGYAEMAARMEELAREQPGFLGIESARNDEGLGITVSYWADEASLHAWGRNAEHLLAQRLGRERWYERFTLRICKVEHWRSFARRDQEDGR